MIKEIPKLDPCGDDKQCTAADSGVHYKLLCNGINCHQCVMSSGVDARIFKLEPIKSYLRGEQHD